MKLETKLTLTRPSSYHVDSKFTESVMSRIETKQSSKMQFLYSLLQRPIYTVLLAVAVVAIVSGSVYAAANYLLPQIFIETVEKGLSPTGRKAATTISSDCNKEISDSQYELKNGASISADDIPRVVQAMCEEDAAASWLRQTYPESTIVDKGSERPTTPNTTFSQHFVAVSPVLVVIDISEESISLQNIARDGTIENINIPKEPRTIVNGIEDVYSTIKLGDPVVTAHKVKTTITTADDCSRLVCGDKDAKSESYELLAIVKLPQPAEWYGKSGQITKITMCNGNPEDVCHYNHAIELYPGPREGSLPTHFDPTPSPERSGREIAGKITKIERNQITIEATSGSIFTIETEYDIVESYNTNQQLDFGTGPIGVGDTIQVNYYGDADEEIALKEITAISLILEETSKTGNLDALNKY